MQARRSRLQGLLRRLCIARGMRWGAVCVILLAAGCGTDLGWGSATDTHESTLGSEIIDEPDEVVPDDDLIDPAGLDDEPVQLTFTAEPAFCCDPLSIEFSAQLSGAPADGAIAYHWEFGDGRTGSGASVEHTYYWHTEYEVVLTAQLPDGATHTLVQMLSLSLDESTGTEVTVTPKPPDAEPQGPSPSVDQPVADAGPNISAVAGESVTLDGGASRPAPAETVTYSWVQTRGTSVTLDANHETSVTFIAPDIRVGTETLAFELTVRAGDLEASDEVTVSITGNHPPSVFDQRLATFAGAPVTLSLRGEDADGQELSFSFITAPSNGTLGSIETVSDNEATVTYTPDVGFTGEEYFTFEANDGLRSVEQAGTCSVDVRRRLVPWVEVNSLDEETIGVAMRGLLNWRRVTDTAIVSTGPRKAALYGELQRRLPEMIIIPGMKTSGIFGYNEFDEVDRWPDLADEVGAVCDASGQNRVVIENELALWDYHEGEDDLDLERVREGLAYLPTDIQYLWYPSAGASGEKLERYIALARVVEDVLENVRFLDHASLNSPDAVDGVLTLQAVAELESFASRSTIPMIYFVTEEQWPFTSVGWTLDYVNNKWGDDAWGIIYPGIARWELAAETIADILLETR